MRRRKFIIALGGAAVWPVAAQGQQMGPLALDRIFADTFASAQRCLAQMGGIGKSRFLQDSSFLGKYARAHTDQFCSAIVFR